MRPPEAEARCAAILQGLLANISTDPLAVERNTSLAVEYLDAMDRKVAEMQARKFSERNAALSDECRTTGYSQYESKTEQETDEPDVERSSDA